MIRQCKPCAARSKLAHLPAKPSEIRHGFRQGPSGTAFPSLRSANWSRATPCGACLPACIDGDGLAERWHASIQPPQVRRPRLTVAVLAYNRFLETWITNPIQASLRWNRPSMRSISPSRSRHFAGLKPTGIASACRARPPKPPFCSRQRHGLHHGGNYPGGASPSAGNDFGYIAGQTLQKSLSSRRTT